ncbi:MAG: capsule assembly Wzi family protein [Gammaproteobacteria bacterium]
MKRVLFAALTLLCLIEPDAHARGVSPYLPLNQDPEMERRIERILMLADKPVLTRPVAAATVLDSLPVACRRDPALCDQVRRYLMRFMNKFDVTLVTIEGAASSGADKTVPNQYGMTTASAWRASASGYYQPSDYALVSLGAVAYEGETVPVGSLVSLGFSRAQLDVGYREHWWSPLSDSSMLLSTEAATMPSVTLSNYVPLTRFGFHYEAFVASMSRSDSIVATDGVTSGRPRVGGLHISMEPAAGWSLGINRILQYGGGTRDSSFKSLFKAFFSPSRYDNTNANLTVDQQFGNQVASITSQFLFPGKTPFAVYFEYAGEDTSSGSNYLLGNSALSAGIRFPHLWKHLDLTYEASEWQNSWYVNSVYGDGLTNKGHVIGHWAGDDRAFSNPVGGQSHMVQLGWEASFGGLMQLRLRTLANEQYLGVPYERAYDATLRYSRPFKQFTVGGEVFGGRNVFGDNFSRVGAFISYDGGVQPRASHADNLDDSSYDVDHSAEIFVDAGLNANRVHIDLAAEQPATRTSWAIGPHFALGARRAVSDRSDLGARLELDSIDGHTLLAVRALDYRYRFGGPIALSVFIGAARYALATPAYGEYFGAGLQWRNLLPGWDAAVDLRYAKKVARDHLLPSDPVSSTQPDSFYDILSPTISLTRRF